MSKELGESSHQGGRTSRHSDYARQTDRDSDRISGQSMHPQQSVWMAHWMHTSCKSAIQSRNHLMLPYEMKGDEICPEQHHLPIQQEIETIDSSSCRKVKDASKAETVNITGGNQRICSENLNEEKSGCLDYADCKPSQRKNNGFALPAAETSSRGHCPQLKDVLHCSDLHSKAHSSFEKNTTTVSRTFEDHFIGSTSRFMPYGVGTQMPAMKSFVCTLEGASQLSPHERNNTLKLLDGPSTSKAELLMPSGKKYEELQGDCGIGSFPTKISPSNPKTSEKLYLGCSALPSMPHSVCDVGTMNICTAIGSVQEVRGGPSKISRTTHHFLISKTTDVDISEKGQLFRESMFSRKIERSPFGGTPYVSLRPGSHASLGLELRSLRNEDTEGEKDGGHVKSSAVKIKNESSSETDTMDMENFQKNHLSGDALYISNKDMKKQNLVSPKAALELCREETDCTLLNADLKHVNRELPAPIDMASPKNSIETSTSRTQSLDAEHLITHVEQSLNPKLNPFPDNIVDPDPSSRWVKRLKLSSSGNLGHGTKISKMSSLHRKEQSLLDQATVLLKKGKSCSIDSARKGLDIAPSHPWIRRWCHNKVASPKKKPEMVVICAPSSSNVASNEAQDKQFPSLAAMALMGKAMNGFHPCEFRKRGSCVVWNVNGL